MGRFRGGELDRDPGWINRKFAELDTALAELSAAKRLVFNSTWSQVDINSMDFTSSFATYGLQSILVPAGYNFATIQMYVTAGVTANGGVADSANVGCQARVGSSGTAVAGPAVSQGRSGPGALSASVGLATKVPLGTGSLNIYAQAYASATSSLVAGSGNVHISASIIFTRS